VTRSRRCSAAVELGLVGVLAAALQGCGEEETVYCTDRDGVVVENRRCGDDRVGGSPFFFLWYGGGAGNPLLSRGQRVPAGGERVASTDKPAIQSRGGFGTSRAGGVGRSVSRGGFGGFSGGG
jgi:hypothetical protein